MTNNSNHSNNSTNDDDNRSQYSSLALARVNDQRRGWLLGALVPKGIPGGVKDHFDSWPIVVFSSYLFFTLCFFFIFSLLVYLLDSGRATHVGLSGSLISIILFVYYYLYVILIIISITIGTTIVTIITITISTTITIIPILLKS